MFWCNWSSCRYVCNPSLHHKQLGLMSLGHERKSSKLVRTLSYMTRFKNYNKKERGFDTMYSCSMPKGHARDAISCELFGCCTVPNDVFGCETIPVRPFWMWHISCWFLWTMWHRPSGYFWTVWPCYVCDNDMYMNTVAVDHFWIVWHLHRGSFLAHLRGAYSITRHPSWSVVVVVRWQGTFRNRWSYWP
jgi:hypothetical protein